jgi:thiamine transport system substrate-binding protein
MIRLLVLAALLVLLVSPALAQDDTVLTVVAHDSFNYTQEVMDAFTAETGIQVEVVRAGDAGTMVNQSILTKGAPLGDVLYGVDNTFLSRALDADIFTPYESPLLENIPAAFDVDAEHRVTPIDYGDVCLNYDVAYFEEHDLAAPESLEALTDPAYKGLLVVENPATSSPGLAFLLATIKHFGETDDYTWQNYWADLAENDLLVVDDWTAAYFGEFSGSAGSEGTYPLVVSYASSPPVEVFYMEEPPETAPTASIVADDMCFRQIEFVGILQGTANEEAAQQFIDFLLSREFQEDMPLNMFVFPVDPEAELPEIFTDYAAIPDNPVTMDVAEIDANRDEWLEQWTQIVLR